MLAVLCNCIYYFLFRSIDDSQLEEIGYFFHFVQSSSSSIFPSGLASLCRFVPVCYCHAAWPMLILLLLFFGFVGCYTVFWWFICSHFTHILSILLLSPRLSFLPLFVWWTYDSFIHADTHTHWCQHIYCTFFMVVFYGLLAQKQFTVSIHRCFVMFHASISLCAFSYGPNTVPWSSIVY